MTTPFPPSPFHIRPLATTESSAVAAILDGYAAREVLLWRTASDIEAHAQYFRVAVIAETIIGCIGLRHYGNDLYEIRSLAVAPEHTGHGVGSALISAIVDLAYDHGGKTVFALTNRPQLFTRNGFEIVPHERFPQKVWFDCQSCFKRDRCDETAVIYTGPQSTTEES